MGGPPSAEAVNTFLRRLFADSLLVGLPLKSLLAPTIAAWRTRRIAQQYAAIGGTSPALEMTRRQSALIAKRLDALSPHTAPHMPLVSFRYGGDEPGSRQTSGFDDEWLQSLEKHAATVQHVVVMPQYPQFSCGTTGSSLGHVASRVQKNARLVAARSHCRWTTVDRWPTAAALVEPYVAAVCRCVKRVLAADADAAISLVFSAHSLPLKRVACADPYPWEVAASVAEISRRLSATLRQPALSHVIAWQSRVGHIPWLSPSLFNVLENLAVRTSAQNSSGGVPCSDVILVPISFCADHVETLYEVDVSVQRFIAAKGVI